MGEFQRSRSKVWWSNYLDADTEEDEPRHVAWGGAGLVLSPSRGSSSSPSSSHKSQDSGFSDSEASTSPGCNAKQLNSAQDVDRNESPLQKSDDEIVEHQDCECPDQKPKETNEQCCSEVLTKEQNSVQPKSPVKKLKGQFLSQCGCLGQNSQEEKLNSSNDSVENNGSNKKSLPENKNVDSSSQLPVKKLREKFLQDCICLSQVPVSERDCNKDKPIVDKAKSPQKALPPTQESANTVVVDKVIQSPQNEGTNDSTRGQCDTSVTQTTPTSSDLLSRPASSLTRAVPVPKIRTPQKDKNRTIKESPTYKSPTPSPRAVKNGCQTQSPIPSPRSSKNNLNRSQNENNTPCSVNKSPSSQVADNVNITQVSLKQNNEKVNVSNQSINSKNQSEALPLKCSNQSPKCEESASTTDLTDCPSASSASSVLPQQLGSPTHTSTPKTSTTNTPNKFFTTPSRALKCLGLGKKQGRPINLLNNFNSNQQSESLDCEKGPVQQWLGELATLYEPECMTTLQSKSLAIDLSHQVALMAATATDTVKMLQDSTKLISTEFAKLCQQLEYGKMEHVGPLVQSLVGHVTEFLQDYCNKEGDNGNASEKKLMEVCDRLRLTAAKQPLDKEEITSEITTLGNMFTSIVDNILRHHISVLVGVLEEPTSDLALRSALTSLATLGLEGPHLSRIVTQCSGIRALLAVCLESRSSTIRTAALRALATICCVVEAIRQLEQAGGLEILSETLAEVKRPEPEVSEAAAVLAQITAPWVEDNHNVQGLSEQLPSLVSSLTRLASNTSSCETLLLAAAALANLTFMEPRTVWPLLEHETAGKLLQAVKKRGPKVSVFLQEQAATLLANMAAVPESRPHLADQRAVVALLCFLQIRHSPLQRANEIAAAERVQQKSAIALSRLCSDPVVAAQVVELQGVNRLVRLCKEERERNHSDGVLVACLAALRKIAANCGTKVIEDLDAMELVEPRLLDSFLIYSSRQESYV